MKTIIAVLLIAITATACNTQIPLTKGVSDNNRTYEIEYLFEHDGCKVYRFWDNGHHVYFTNCQGSTSSISNDSIPHRTYNEIRIR